MRWAELPGHHPTIGWDMLYHVVLHCKRNELSLLAHPSTTNLFGPPCRLPIKVADEQPSHRSTKDWDELPCHLPTWDRGELPSHHVYCWNRCYTTLHDSATPVVCNTTRQYVKGGGELLRHHSTKHGHEMPRLRPTWGRDKLSGYNSVIAWSRW